MPWKTDCELVSDKFKVVSKSSHLNDNGTVLCKNGQMFYEESFIPNITARCNKNAEWDFNSTNLHCLKGKLIIYTKNRLKVSNKLLLQNTFVWIKTKKHPSFL